MSKPGPKPKPFHERVRVDSGTGCHLWTGKIDVYGYGKAWIDGREVIASRHAWLLRHGTEPGRLCVLHRCDTPACVNPDHLFLGTRSDNAADKVAKGRAKGPPKGVVFRSKLSPREVKAIRRDGRSGAEIARDCGVSKTTANDIRARRTWVCLP